MMTRFLLSLVATTVLILPGSTVPVRAAEQNPQLEVGPPRPVRELGATLAATALNSVYVPVRFALTATAAVVGGCVGLINGGDADAAAAVWANADGDAFVTPDMIEHRRWPRLGRSR